MRVAAVLSALTLVVLGGSASGSMSTDLGAPVYQVIWTRPDQSDSVLSRRDPRTLQRIGRSVRVGGDLGEARFSPDGRTLAMIVHAKKNDSLKLLDVVRVRWLGSAPIPPGRGPAVVRWLTRDRLLVLQNTSSGRMDAFVFDASSLRIAHRTGFRGDLAGGQLQYPVAAVRAGAVALLATAGQLQPARLAIIRSTGAVRVLALGRMLAGSRLERATGLLTVRQPALAVDPASSHAYVVGAKTDPIADVDVARLNVVYHDFPPATGYTGAAASWRLAAFAGDAIALSGSDFFPNGATTKAGLQLVNTATWRPRLLDPGLDVFWPARGLLVAFHEHAVLAYSVDGRLRFDTKDDRIPLQVSFAATNGRFFYDLDSGLVFDLRSGSVVGPARVLRRLPGRLLSPAQRFD